MGDHNLKTEDSGRLNPAIARVDALCQNYLGQQCILFMV